MARTRPTRPPARRPARRRFPVWPVVIGVVLLGGVIVIVLAAVSGDDSSEANGGAAAIEESAPPVQVEGDALVDFASEDDDPAVGQAFPTLSGRDLEGESFSISPGDQPMIVLYIAHWCPHCEREVPRVQEWVDGGNLPSEVALVGVATGIDPSRPNYPTSAWLEEEGWTAPTLIDPDNSAAAAGGLSGYPFFVAIGGDGRVVARTSGELNTDQLDALVDSVQG